MAETADKETKAEKATRVRRANARSASTVIALLEERVSILPATDGNKPHAERMLDLLDELNRSLGRKTASEE